MRRDGGFTLLEVLVALTVLGLLMAGLTQGVRFGLLAWDRQSRAIDARGELDAVDRVLRRLVEQMDPGSARAAPGLAGLAHEAAFTTDLGPAAGPLSVREADIRLSLRAGDLLLQWRPHLHAVRLAPPPPPSDILLLRGVAGLDIAYWGAAGDAAPGWLAEWRAPRLPLLVRLRLRLPDGDRRHWPDIVAAPRRAPRP